MIWILLKNQSSRQRNRNHNKKTMKRTVTIVLLRRMVSMAGMAVMPVVLPAQTLKESVNKLEQSVNQLKTVADYPAQMEEWDKAKARYNDSIAKRDELQKEVKKDDSILTNLKGRYSKIEKLSSYIRPNVECQAEAILTRRYNANDVQQALRNLDPTTDIAKRLTQYEAMTNQLKKVLLESDKDVTKRRSYVSETGKEEYLKSVFGRIQNGLPSAFFAPEAYPYLCKVLNEALDTKMEDTCYDFSDIINEKL